MPCLLLKDLPEIHAAAKDAGVKVTLHRFPSDPALQKRWYSAIEPFQAEGRCDRQLAQLCSLHFKPTDFIRTNLIEGSIPSVFSPPSTAELNRTRAYARCCVPGCPTSDLFNLHPFVPEHDAAQAELARKRYRLWVRTLQVAPCPTRPQVWICRRHFVHGFPAKLIDCQSVDWVPSLALEGITSNPCRECSVVLQKLPDVHNLDAPFCRLCLAQDVTLQAMFLDSSAGQRLAELIEQLATVKIDLRMDSDGSVCIECLEKLAQMEQMEQVRARWNANNDLLERLRGRNNNQELTFKEDPQVQEVNSLPVVSIPLDTLINSICEAPKEESVPLAYDDFKQDLEQAHPANISQDCIMVDPPTIEVVDLTDIDERERLIRKAMRGLRRQLNPGKRKRKRSKTNLKTLDKPAPHRKPCRNTRIG